MENDKDVSPRPPGTYMNNDEQPLAAEGVSPRPPVPTVEGPSRKLCKVCGKNLVMLRGRHPSGTPYYRSTCSTCHRRARAAFVKANDLSPRNLPAPPKPLEPALKGHDSCMLCGFVAVHPCQLDLDHFNGDRGDNSPHNILVLCSNCHRLKSGIEAGWIDSDQPRISAWIADPTREVTPFTSKETATVKLKASRIRSSVYYDGETWSPSEFLRQHCPWCSISAGIQYLKRHSPEDTIEHYRPKDNPQA